MLICSHCRTIYFKEYIVPNIDGEYYCPNSKCLEDVLIEVDEDLSDIVLKFLNIGLEPKFSCEGHINKPLFNPYIRFIFSDKSSVDKFYSLLKTKIIDVSNEYSFILLEIIEVPPGLPFEGLFFDINVKGSIELSKKDRFFYKMKFIQFLYEIYEKYTE